MNYVDLTKKEIDQLIDEKLQEIAKKVREPNHKAETRRQALIFGIRHITGSDFMGVYPGIRLESDRDWIWDLENADDRLDKAKAHAAEITKKHFPEGTQFKLGQQTYRVLSSAYSWWSDPMMCICENVVNGSRRRINVHTDRHEIEDIIHPRQCRECGCTNQDCSQCVEKTGQPCWWVEQDLCSACAVEVPSG